MVDFRAVYAEMLDDQLLNLAQEVDGLSPDARSALIHELRTRSLSQGDISDYAKHLRRIETAALPIEPIAHWINGVGTGIYGKRAFSPDGSFVTTKWIILFWLPLFPLRSLRVRLVGPIWNRKYLTLAILKTDIRQAINVYAYFALLLVGLVVLRRIRADSVVCLVSGSIWLCIPWAARSAGWHRMARTE
jgi:hypothetical protein